VPVTTAFWLSAFLDFAPEDVVAGTAFWRGATGFSVSESRGDAGEFATLVPRDGDDYLRIQRLGAGPSRLHLDVHVLDPRAAADRAVSSGAREIADHGYVLLSSPGGMTFCFVSHPGAVRPQPATWPGGHLSGITQICLDLPAASYDVEAAFWTGLLGAEREHLVRRPEFTWLRQRPPSALDVLLQRLDREDGPVTAHLDLGTTDRDAETMRHQALGAEILAVDEFWTVLRDPVGTTYCLTDRDPRTRRLDG
jgi:Glyoxalase-like domain